MTDIQALADMAVAAHEGNSVLPLMASRGERIVKTVGVCDGKPRVANTRIPLWILLGYRHGKERLVDSQILSLFPDLTLEDLAAAWEYADKNPGDCVPPA